MPRPRKRDLPKWLSSKLTNISEEERIMTTREDFWRLVELCRRCSAEAELFERSRLSRELYEKTKRKRDDVEKRLLEEYAKRRKE